MNVYVLQHSSDTPPGSLLEWFSTKKFQPKTIKMFAGESLPAAQDVDWVIVLGGAMNVDHHDLYPWLAQEKDFLRQLIADGKTCLGLCLGGQLIAQALGGTVTKHEHWEVGWHAVTIGADSRLMVFQWHEDTFSLPPGATRVATNKICENQAFMFGDRIVGLQFHPEATEEWIREHIADPEQPSGPHVKSPESMTDELIFIRPMKKWFFELLNRLETLTLSKDPKTVRDSRTIKSANDMKSALS